MPETSGGTNELFDLKKVDPNDELERFAFYMHCSEVYDMMCEENTRMVAKGKERSSSATLKLYAKEKLRGKSKSKESSRWQR